MGRQSEPGGAETHQSKAEWASKQRGEGELYALDDTDLVDPSAPKVDLFGYMSMHQ